MAETNDYDIIFIVETWLNRNVQNALLCPKGYNLLRRDRNGKRGGGIMIIYKSNLSIAEVRNSEHDTLEYICIDVLGKKRSKAYRFICLYVPPDVSKDRTTVENICRCLTCYNNNDLFYVLGDFNMPSISWGPAHSNSSVGSFFTEYCDENLLRQHVTESTHVSGSILDLLLCNEVSSRKLISIDVLPPMTTTCDHNVLEILISRSTSKSEVKGIDKFLRLHNGDYTQINKVLATVNWSEKFIYFNNDIQLIYDDFLHIIHSLMDKHIPTTKFNPRVKQPRRIVRMAKRKRVLYKKNEN